MRAARERLLMRKLLTSCQSRLADMSGEMQSTEPSSPFTPTTSSPPWQTARKDAELKKERQCLEKDSPPFLVVLPSPGRSHPASPAEPRTGRPPVQKRRAGLAERKRQTHTRKGSGKFMT